VRPGFASIARPKFIVPVPGAEIYCVENWEKLEAIKKWNLKNPKIDMIGVRIQKFSSIRIRIHKVIESGSNPDPDPQQYIRRQVFSKIKKSTKKVCTLYYFYTFQ
jgi:hypothetical protein